MNKENKNKKGFTLIEILVVVLIIGILAAVALPQYRRAVEKSHATQGLSIIKPIWQSIESYYLVHNIFPSSFDELDIDIPWSDEEGPNISGVIDTRSNGEWSAQLYGGPGATISAIIITRKTGRYKGGQFIMFKNHNVASVPTDTLLCGEWRSTEYAISKDGLFCRELFNGQNIVSGSAGSVWTFRE